MNWQLYPEDILKPTTPYVYFDDIPEEIGNVVSPILNQKLNTFTSDSGENNIEQAFAFLKGVISSERTKETAFLQYLKEKTKGKFDLQPPSLEEDWGDFVKEIQSILDYGNLGLTDLQNEYNRLVKNKQNYEQAIEQGKKEAYYESDTMKKTSQDLKNILNVFKSGQRQNAGAYSTQILRLIIDRFGSKLIQIKNGQLSFNQSELAALIIMVTQMVMKNYRSKLAAINNTHKNIDKTSSTSLTLMDSLDDEMLETLDTAVEQFTKFPHIRQQIVKTYKLRGDNKGKKNINSKQFVDPNNLLKDSDEVINAIFQILENYEIPDGVFKVIQVVPNLAEADSLLKMLGTGATTVINTGSLNAKPDNIIGYITGDLSKLDPIQGKDAEILRRIERINQLIEKNMLDKANGGLSSKNTAEYYEMRRKMWNQLEDDIKNELKELRELCDFFSSCFLLEDSTKNYLSLYSRMEGNSLMNAPHGGSLGANLDDQIDKIDQLTHAGNITMIDRQWLIAALINSGPKMIASQQKSSLEDYLSMFAAILLFDSQLNIAQDALKNMTNEVANGGVFNIHLFSVNNGYYPLSYVLKLTYDSLTIGLEQARTEATTQGVEVEIYGYLNKPEGEGKSAWSATAEAAKKSTKIKMRFMVKLMNVIQNLLQLNP